MNKPLTNALMTVSDIKELNGTIIKAKDKLKRQISKEDIADIIETMVSIGIYKFVGNSLIDTLEALVMLEKYNRKRLQDIIGDYLNSIEEREKYREENRRNKGFGSIESPVKSTLEVYEYYLERSSYISQSNIDEFDCIDNISFKKLKSRLLKIDSGDKIKEQYKKLCCLDNKELAGLFIIIDIVNSKEFGW